MDNKKSDGIEFHLGVALREISDELGIRSYVLNELRNSSEILNGDEEDTLNGKRKLHLTKDKFQNVLLNAIREYVQDMKQGHVPQKYAMTLAKRNEYREIQNKKIETTDRYRKDYKKDIDNIIATMYSFSEFPLVNDNKFNKELTDNVTNSCKELFSQQTCRNIYIFNRNMDAFMVVVDRDRKVFEFCKSIFSLDKLSMKSLQHLSISHAFSEMSHLLTSKYLWQWLKIRTEYYNESGEPQIPENQTNMYKSSTKDKSELIEKTINELCKRTEKFPPIYSIMPIWMVLLTKFLIDVDYIDLLTGFLCCNSTDRELLLEKAQQLSERDENATKQTSDNPI